MIKLSRTLLRAAILAGFLVLGFALPASAQQVPEGSNVGIAGTLNKEKADQGNQSSPVYSPYADRNFPTRPLFGDTHLHTAFSMDAGAFGARLDPRDAYQFRTR